MSQKSRLARQVTLDKVCSSSEHSEICCLIYATQNGWKLPILFEEMGVPYDWALVDFEKSEQRVKVFFPSTQTVGFRHRLIVRAE